MDVFIEKIQKRRINKRYSLICKIGEGGFGAVYRGRDHDSNQDVALKLEHKSTEPSVLEEEADKYGVFQGANGFPAVHWFGWHDDFKVMAFELLGPSLEDLFQFCGRRFSLKTTLMIMDQLLYRMEHMHSKGVVHRDIKPRNFLMGLGAEGNVIYVTDFGLVREYSTSCASPTVVAPRQPRLVGTTRFASIAGHKGQAQSPRDDLESLGYMVVYFMKGMLPWQGTRVRSDERKEQVVMKQKIDINNEQLCKGLPVEFVSYFRRVQSLEHGVTPDYTEIRQMILRMAKTHKVEFDCVFDWTVRLYRQHQRT